MKQLLCAVFTLLCFLNTNAQIRNTKGIMCSERALSTGGWQPNPAVYNAKSTTTLDATSSASSTQMISIQASVSAGIQNSLIPFIKADATVNSSVQAQMSTTTTFAQKTSIPVELKPRQQARFVLKGLFYTFSAEYYNTSTKKWTPFTFDRLVKQGIFVEYRMQ